MNKTNAYDFLCRSAEASLKCSGNIVRPSCRKLSDRRLRSLPFIMAMSQAERSAQHAASMVMMCRQMTLIFPCCLRTAPISW